MALERYVIINADDFGLCQGTNEAVKKAHQKGILTSASLLVTTPGFKSALRVIKQCPKLGLGIHLSLTWGKAVLSKREVPDLVDQEGYFYSSYARLILKTMFCQNYLQQAEKEFCAQIRKVTKMGIKIDHLDSHQHVHMIPQIFPIFLKIARKYKIKYIRIPREKFFLVSSFPEATFPFLGANLIKFSLMRFFTRNKVVEHQPKFYGLLYTSKMNKKILKKILSRLDSGLSEIFLHPGKLNFSKDDQKFDFRKQKILRFIDNPARQIEFTSLLDKQLRKIIKENEIILTSYRELKYFKSL